MELFLFFLFFKEWVFNILKQVNLLNKIINVYGWKYLVILEYFILKVRCFFIIKDY